MVVVWDSSKAGRLAVMKAQSKAAQRVAVKADLKAASWDAK